GPLAAPCTRRVIGAVPGGFLSAPTATANAALMPVTAELPPKSPVQLWNPVSGTAARTYHIDPGWIRIDGASGQYLAWQSPSATGRRVSSVEITNVSTGVTRRTALPISAGDVTWRAPVLAPRGPYLAWVKSPRPPGGSGRCMHLRAQAGCQLFSGRDASRSS